MILKTVDATDRELKLNAKRTSQDLIRREHEKQIINNASVRGMAYQSNLNLEQQALAYDRMLKAEQDAIQKERR